MVASFYLEVMLPVCMCFLFLASLGRSQGGVPAKGIGWAPADGKPEELAVQELTCRVSIKNLLINE